MEAVHVFCRVDQTSDALGVQSFRQGHLAQNAVHRGIGVERGYLRFQFGLGGGGGHKPVAGGDPHSFRGLDLVPHVGVRRGVIAQQNDGKAGGCAASG